MKRSRFARRGALNRDAEQIARLAAGLAASASRISLANGPCSVPLFSAFTINGSFTCRITGRHLPLSVRSNSRAALRPVSNMSTCG